MASITHSVVSREQFPLLLNAIRAFGYVLIGPTVRDHAIVYDEIDGVDDLPIGWTDKQGAGTYRIERRQDSALFGYNAGPHSWKKFLHVPLRSLCKASKTDTGFELEQSEGERPRLAFIGVRSCELHAILIQDRVLMGEQYTDSDYAARRENAFIVAVQCAQAGATCFCVSMNTGPRATAGFDLALTERIDGERHEFLIEVGSDQGAGILAQVPHRTAAQADWNRALHASQQAASQMGRQMDTNRIKELLYRNLEHARWDDVAQRCLACANCTMVCPTCFCTAVEDVTDLSGETAERIRRWDSCFNSQFSYIHSGSVRQTTKSRYRQWMTHKLASWQDQFGSSGCVGCGRCITWCPVGIDITEEVAAIRADEKSNHC